MQGLTHLENLIEAEERFINEFDQFDKNQLSESPISLGNQRKMNQTSFLTRTNCL